MDLRRLDRLDVGRQQFLGRDALVPSGMTNDAYVALGADPDIDRKITAKKAEIALLADAEVIRVRQPLGVLETPQPPGNLSTMLLKTIEGVSSDAEQRVRDHLTRHNMEEDGERWLSDGLAYATGEDCPFCAQPLIGSGVVHAYGQFFNRAYRAFQDELNGFKQMVEAPLGDAKLLSLQKRISGNAALAEFWRKHTLDPVPSLDFDVDIEPVIRQLREALVPLVEQKQASPLVAVNYPPGAQLAIRAWMVLRDKVNAYNESVIGFNSSIEKLKAVPTAKSINVVRAELTLLEAQKNRHEENAKTAVEAQLAAKAAKLAAESEKEEAKRALDEYNREIIQKYHAAVNELLDRFGAAFRLATVEVQYTGRTPRVGYTFELRGKEIHPGSDSTPAGSPCFGNTLSTGDRNTLALAFFIAQVSNRSDLGDLVIVFDDPFTSLDAFRQTWTCNKIRKLATQAKQVIVLSHSLEFLRLLAEGCEKAVTKALKIDVHNGIDSRIIELDLNDATIALIEKDVIKVRSYFHGDDKDGAGTIRAIRPLLENFIRRNAPDSCPEGKGWLGDFLGDIKKAPPTSPLAQFQPVYDDMDHLNTYTRAYSHDSGKAPTINEAELRANAGLTLKLIGRR